MAIFQEAEQLVKGPEPRETKQAQDSQAFPDKGSSAETEGGESGRETLLRHSPQGAHAHAHARIPLRP